MSSDYLGLINECGGMGGCNIILNSFTGPRGGSGPTGPTGYTGPDGIGSGACSNWKVRTSVLSTSFPTSPGQMNKNNGSMNFNIVDENGTDQSLLFSTLTNYLKISINFD